jgi:hypothetical protein
MKCFRLILADRRPYLEGPIPGYKGYIPRMAPLGVGLGLRYQVAAKKALDRFSVESTNSMTNFSPAADNSPADYNNRAK